MNKFLDEEIWVSPEKRYNQLIPAMGKTKHPVAGMKCVAPLHPSRYSSGLPDSVPEQFDNGRR